MTRVESGRTTLVRSADPIEWVSDPLGLRLVSMTSSSASSPCGQAE